MECINDNLKTSVSVFFTSICLTLFLFIQGFSQTKNEYYYLNSIDKSGEWKLNDTVKTFQGDELFYLINGGAELYIEYGFIEVAAAEYIKNDTNSIYIEIYKMKNNNAAFGIYTLSRVGGEILEIGNQANLYNYYVLLWKGNYFVTISSSDKNAKISGTLIHFAKAIEFNIEAKGTVPDIIELLPHENRNQTTIKYILGNIALNNIYFFDYKDIFDIAEGVVCDYENYSIFILKYKNPEESRHWFEKAKKCIINKSKFSNYRQVLNGYSVTDRNQNHIYFEPYKNFILIIFDKNNSDIDLIVNSIKENINSTFKF